MDDMNEMQKKMKERIESEARATMRISNKDLICRDCEFVLDDSEVFGNVKNNQEHLTPYRIPVTIN